MSKVLARVMVGLVMGGLFTPACGSKDDDAPPAVAKENFAAEATRAVCDNIEACCSTDTAFDSAACQSTMAGLFADELAAASLQYDAAQAGKCVAALRTTAQACGDVAYVTDCDTVFTGGVPPGGPCVSDIECATGAIPFARCDATQHCVQAVSAKAGEPCNCTLFAPDALQCIGLASEAANLVCADGLVCGADPVAGDRRCAVRVGLGADCSNAPCAEGTVCNYAATSGAPTCVALTPLFGDCRATGSCVEGALCYNGTCVELKDDGAPCSASNECKSYACNPQGRCAADAPFLTARVCL